MFLLRSKSESEVGGVFVGVGVKAVPAPHPATPAAAGITIRIMHLWKPRADSDRELIRRVIASSLNILGLYDTSFTIPPLVCPCPR